MNKILCTPIIPIKNKNPHMKIIQFYKIPYVKELSEKIRATFNSDNIQAVFKFHQYNLDNILQYVPNGLHWSNWKIPGN